jgi:hypothetical protein
MGGKYAVEMGSVAIIYIPSFIQIGSGVQKFIGEWDTQTHRLYGDFVIMLKIDSLPHRKHSVSITTIKLFRETVAVYFENHTEHINTLCG